MSNKFLKPFIPNPKILDPKVGDPLGYVTNDGLWASIPCGKSTWLYIMGTRIVFLTLINNLLTILKSPLRCLKRKVQ